VSIEPKYHFASDNTSGICPEAWLALEEANQGYQPSYGADAITAEACESFRRFFETDCDVYFVFNGTAANSLALASMCRSYNSIITAHEAHVETDECGAPEFFSHGSKILLARSPLGTVYRPGEIAGLGALAKQHGLGIHMDGARFFNALAGQNCAPADITWRAGVDVLCCGGTKLGMAVTEAVVFFNKELSQDFQYRCKQAGQLCSKMRFISAQWLRMLTNDAWKKHATSANALAKKLADTLGHLAGVQILYPVDANAVFAKLPDKMRAGLKERGWVFYSFIGGGTRLMCSWRTTEADVEAFVADAARFT
jgi:threonine aldolase